MLFREIVAVYCQNYTEHTVSDNRFLFQYQVYDPLGCDIVECDVNFRRLKLEPTGASETSVGLYQTTQSHILQECELVTKKPTFVWAQCRVFKH
jgi:hypothetical protein